MDFSKKMVLGIVVAFCTYAFLPLFCSKAEAGPKTLRLKVQDRMMQVDGSNLEIDPGNATVPVISGGHTFVPIRSIVESFDGSITLDNEKKILTIIRGSDVIEYKIGDTTALVNGVQVALDAIPFINANGRLLMPLRFVGEKMGLKLKWDGNKQEIELEEDIANNGEDAWISQAVDKRWVGIWDTSYGLLKLLPKQDTIRGEISEKSGTGEKYEITGKTESDILSGTWTIGVGMGQGMFSFSLSQTTTPVLLTFTGQMTSTTGDVITWQGTKLTGPRHGSASMSDVDKNKNKGNEKYDSTGSGIKHFEDMQGTESKQHDNKDSNKKGNDVNVTGSGIKSED